MQVNLEFDNHLPTSHSFSQCLDTCPIKLEEEAEKAKRQKQSANEKKEIQKANEKTVKVKEQTKKERKTTKTKSNTDAKSMEGRMEQIKAQVHKETEKINEVCATKAKEIKTIIKSISEAEDDRCAKDLRRSRIDGELEDLHARLAHLVEEKQKMVTETLKNNKHIEKLHKKKMKLEKTIDVEMELYLENKKAKQVALEEMELKLATMEEEEEMLEEASSGNSRMVDFLQQAIKDKEKDLECPVCLETATSPIFSCPESHVICSECRPR